MKKRIDMTGQKFGRLIVLKFVENKNHNSHWKCLCDCGNKKIVSRGHLMSGDTLSCGCFNIEMTKISNSKHNLRQHPLYMVWSDVKTRCSNPNRSCYRDYGGRGISVFKEWVEDFKKFYDFCISNGWERGLMIDRIDTNGNYEPGNCRFVSQTIQNRNSRKSKYWVINGVRYESSIVAGRAFNVHPETIRRWCYDGNNKNCYAYYKY